MKKLAFALLMLTTSVQARDLGQWENTDPAIKEWFQTLQRPDSPGSCCGEADAYWCDNVYTRKDPNTHKDKTYCKITDDRPDGPRPHIDIGTEIYIPNEKLKWDRSNPTGHAIVFVGPGPYHFVFCFVQGTGI